MEPNIEKQLLEEAKKQTKLLENVCIWQKGIQRAASRVAQLTTAMTALVLILLALQVVGCFVGQMGEATHRLKELDRKTR